MHHPPSRNSIVIFDGLIGKQRSARVQPLKCSHVKTVRASSAPAGDSGFVLVTVLLGIALLAAVALALSHASRLNLKTRSLLSRGLDAKLVADGLAKVVAVRAADRAFLQRWRDQSSRTGGATTCRSGDDVVTISIIDAGGLVDLNAAPRLLLERLLLGLGQSEGRAGAIAAAIIEFRDDGDSSSRSAKAEAYRISGMPHGPKNAPFETVVELDQVLGITPEIYRQLRPLITVHSRLPGIDLLASPPEVRTVLIGRPPSDAETARAAADAPRNTLPPEFLIGSLMRAFVIRAEVVSPSGVRFSREAVVELDSDRAGGIAIVDWSAPLPMMLARPDLQQRSTKDCLTMIART